MFAEPGLFVECLQNESEYRSPVRNEKARTEPSSIASEGQESPLK